MDSGILRNCAACSPGRADLAWSPGWYGRGSLWSGSPRPFSLASGGGLRAASRLSTNPITSSVRTADVAIRFRDFSAVRLDQNSCFCISTRRAAILPPDKAAAAPC